MSTEEAVDTLAGADEVLGFVSAGIQSQGHDGAGLEWAELMPMMKRLGSRMIKNGQSCSTPMLQTSSRFKATKQDVPCLHNRDPD